MTTVLIVILSEAKNLLLEVVQQTQPVLLANLWGITRNGKFVRKQKRPACRSLLLPDKSYIDLWRVVRSTRAWA